MQSTYKNTSSNLPALLWHRTCHSSPGSGWSPPAARSTLVTVTSTFWSVSAPLPYCQSTEGQLHLRGKKFKFLCQALYPSRSRSWNRSGRCHSGGGSALCRCLPSLPARTSGFVVPLLVRGGGPQAAWVRPCLPHGGGALRLFRRARPDPFIFIFFILFFYF